jgi:hypothetical protein
MDVVEGRPERGRGGRQRRRRHAAGPRGFEGAEELLSGPKHARELLEVLPRGQVPIRLPLRDRGPLDSEVLGDLVLRPASAPAGLAQRGPEVTPVGHVDGLAHHR